ncbi:MAG: ABC transporter ATP-binding protein [Tenericutes bacterium]|jgi:ATP-binding cassette subfamily B protein|nr:ABC transporter ATP-binding protein [Mycoplasmatota bacterium]
MNYNFLQNAKYVYSQGDRFNKSYKYKLIITFFLKLIIPIIATIIPTAVVYFITNNFIVGDYLLIMAIIVLSYALINYINSSMSFKIEIESTFIRTKCFWEMLTEKVMSTGYENIESKVGQAKLNKAAGSIGSNWTGVELLLKSFPGFIVSLTGLLLYSTYIMTINISIVFLLIGMSLMNLLLNTYARKYEKRTEDELNQHRIKLTYYQNEAKKLVNGKDIRIYKLESWFYKGIKFFTKSFSKMVTKQRGRYSLANFSDSIFTIARDLLAYSILVVMVINSQINVTEFTFMIGIVTGFSVWLNQLSESFSRLKESNIGINNFREYMKIDDLTKTDGGVDITPLLNQALTIEFKNVSFTYPESKKPTISNLNLKINSGEKVALVGINGAGKTTIVKLLSGLYHPSKGEVLINDIPISDFNTLDYFNLISVIFQDVNTFAFTIAQNVSGASNENTNFDKVRNSLEMAGLLEKVQSLEKKEHTYLTQVIDDKGIMLSGGQLQKLMLARALYKNAPILILDEPTAALDPLAEQELYLQYSSLTKNKTSMFISHRLSSTQFCDRVIYIENGSIQEEGSHIELMKKKGKYAEMFKIQSRYYKENKKEVLENEKI